MEEPYRLLRGMTLVEEIKNDPERGAQRLVDECKPGLFALARRLCDDDGDAEELVNRTLAEAVANIDSLLSQSALFGWMCKILVGCHSKDIRRKSRSEEFAVGDISDDFVDRGADERVFRDVDAALVRDAIATLPREMRETLVLHYFADMSIAQIARYVAVPAGTVKSRLHYARLALAERLRVPARRAAFFAVALVLLAASVFATVSAWRVSMRAVETRTVEETVRRTREALVNYYGEIPPDPFAPAVEQGASSLQSSNGENTEMNIASRSAALGAAVASILAATAAAEEFFVSGWPIADKSVRAVSAATSLAIPPSVSVASPTVLDARNRAVGVSAPRALRSDEYGGFMILIR